MSPALGQLIAAAAILLTPTARAAAKDTTNLAALEGMLPKCSLSCIVHGVTENNCTLTDFECACKKFDAIVKTTSPCLVDAGCSLDQMANVTTVVAGVCQKIDPGFVEPTLSASGAAAPSPTSGSANGPLDGLALAGAAAIALAVALL